jgi:guanylate kinase
MNKLNNIIVCILGKSGCGKTTIVEKLQEEYGYEVLSSYTTRPQRYEGESGHQFVDLQTFNDLPDKVAYNKFNDYHYCATKSQVDESDL